MWGFEWHNFGFLPSEFGDEWLETVAAETRVGGHGSWSPRNHSEDIGPSGRSGEETGTTSGKVTRSLHVSGKNIRSLGHASQGHDGRRCWIIPSRTSALVKCFFFSINRNENPRFALSDRNNVTPLAVKLTVVDLLPGSRNVTARELSYRSTLTYRHESQLLPNDCIFIATRAFLSLSLVKTRKLERGRGIGIAVCESNFNYTSGGLWLREKSNEAYFIDSSLCRALLRKKMRGGECNAWNYYN